MFLEGAFENTIFKVIQVILSNTEWDFLDYVSHNKVEI